MTNAGTQNGRPTQPVAKTLIPVCVRATELTNAVVLLGVAAVALLVVAWAKSCSQGARPRRLDRPWRRVL